MEMNAINIQVKSTEIPVNIGGLEFTMQVTDEAIEQYSAKRQEIEARYENAEGNMDDVKNIQRDSIDWLLGDGAYDKIYAKYPSTIVITQIAPQLMIEFGDRIQELGKLEQSVQDRYDAILKAKAAKRKKK